MVRISSAFGTVAVATINLVSTTLAIDTTVSSGFAASDGSVTFALNIPQDDSNSLYFTMSGPSSQSWIAIGMGSNEMKGSLMWYAYKDSTGKNVTFSPRLSDGHVEPSYASDIVAEVQAGTGISNGNYTLNVKCTNCRKWKGGSIDPTNTKAKFIFASGPNGALNSNSKSANTKRHSSYGAFEMDLTKAVGVGQVPVAAFADSTGTKETQDKTDHDFSAALHACVMILAFVGLMPIGILILRILNSPKWHALNQGLSVAVALIGAALGVYVGTMYNRTKNYNSVHQILGIVVIIAMIAQFVLGYMHHRIYKRTLATTKLAPIHVWLGRVVIPLGIADGFLGFPLALNSKYNWALLGLCLLVIIILGPFAFWRYKRNLAKKNLGDVPTGYQAQPWRSDNSAAQSDINLSNMDYPPQQYGQQQQNHPPLYQQHDGRGYA